MAKTYRALMVADDVLEQLKEFQKAAAETVLYQGNQLGLGEAIRILLWHFCTTPPDPDAFKAQVQAAPRRGRPAKPKPPPLP